MHRFLSAALKIVRRLAMLVLAFAASKGFLLFIFGWFLLQGAYLAASTQFGIPSDEVYHHAFIHLFSDRSWTPFLPNQEGFYLLGEATKTPFFLYHYLMSFPHRFLHELPHEIFALRMINVALGTVSLYLVYRLADRLRLSPLVRNLSLFMLANTLMFLFTSTSISYDNLFIPLSLGSTLMLLRLWKQFSARHLWALIVILLAGSLTKINFLPVALITVALLGFRYRHRPRVLLQMWRTPFDKARLILMAGAAVLSILFVQRYVVNWFTYGDVTPRCLRVLTLEQCRENHIFQRGERLDASPKPPVDRSMYAYAVDWVELMQRRTYGIHGHKQAAPMSLVMVGAQLLLVVGLIAVIRGFKRRETGINLLIIISATYLMVLFFKNHATYEYRGLIEHALQGRYALSVLPLMYLAANYHIMKLLRPASFKAGYAAAVIVIFMLAGLPSYLTITDASWHNPGFTGINERLKQSLVKSPLLP